MIVLESGVPPLFTGDGFESRDDREDVLVACMRLIALSRREFVSFNLLDLSVSLFMISPNALPTEDKFSDWRIELLADGLVRAVPPVATSTGIVENKDRVE